MGLQVGQVGFKLPLLPLRLLLLPLLRLPPGKKPQPHLGGIKKAFVRHERHSVNGARQGRAGQEGLLGVLGYTHNKEDKSMQVSQMSDDSFGPAPPPARWILMSLTELMMTIPVVAAPLAVFFRTGEGAEGARVPGLKPICHLITGHGAQRKRC